MLAAARGDFYMPVTELTYEAMQRTIDKIRADVRQPR